MHRFANRTSPTKQPKKENDSGEKIQIATRNDPSNPFNPLHPDETSVWGASRRGF